MILIPTIIWQHHVINPLEIFVGNAGEAMLTITFLPWEFNATTTLVKIEAHSPKYFW